MTELLKTLCELNGTSGDEGAVRDFIISKIDGFCKWRKDPLGNILFEKEGKNEPKVRVMLDAHTDEVGFIVTSVGENGLLKFSAVGGIECETLLFKRVVINTASGEVAGVIGSKPVHLCRGEEAKTLPDISSLFIDIGAKDGAEAKALVSEGDCGVVCGEFIKNGNKIISKALDDRVGCAVLITLIREEAEYGFCGSFSVMEEIGCIGARTAAYTLAPQAAIVLEGTTAADISGVPEDRTVCKSGEGVAVSFMDGGTVYDRGLYETALASGIPCQKKKATTGGNDAAAIHLSREGVKTLALSVPCRYIHSPSSVCDIRDIESMLSLSRYMIKELQNG